MPGIASKLLFKRVKPKLFLSTGFALIAFRFFCMFVRMFYGQAVHVDKVLVNPRCVQSVEQLLQSDLVVCLAEDYLAYELDADKATALNRLFSEKSLGAKMNSKKFPNRCVIDFGTLKTSVDMYKKAMFIKASLARSFLVIWAQWKTQRGEVKFWQSPSLFDVIYVHFYRAGLSR